MFFFLLTTEMIGSSIVVVLKSHENDNMKKQNAATVIHSASTLERLYLQLNGRFLLNYNPVNWQLVNIVM